ncbi:5-formyltetrahydrofolate cyclo-ligase [Romboutsia sp.]|uniref:5-formyltetrahydrofolate cyclo-ligase n=1 Tax=Romboutsia sp. TaxID=1965302 RepID=UPI003F3554BB
MKKEFRKNVIADRKKQPHEFIAKNSSIITEKLLSMDCVKNAKIIMLYLDFNNEVQTTELVNKLLCLNKVVATPVTIMDKRELVPCQITDLKEGIKIGAYGIREPKEDCSPRVNIEDIDLVIVPAVAYDEDCYRLGYGGGFYDRFLNRLRDDSLTVGIAFDLQIFDTVPKESHDAQLDYIITESRVLTPSR